MPRRRSSLYWLRIIDRTVPILLPVLVAVVGAGWTAYQFLEAQTKEARIRIEASEAEAKRQAADSERFRIARRIEAQQPFLEKQLALYIKAMETVGIFVTDPDSSQRAEAKRTFERLFWSELPMVEHVNVEQAMVNMRSAIEKSDQAEMRRRSYCLAHAIRDSIQSSWDISFGRTEGAQQPVPRASNATPEELKARLTQNDGAPPRGGAPPIAANEPAFKCSDPVK
jgi:hypothetical protein